ncbi:MAG: hypothetical protein V3W34_09665 [Phycisphaerae bacterium]
MDDRTHLLDYESAAVGASAFAAAETLRRGPSPVLFWTLVLMSSAVFAPCVIVPLWQNYSALKMAEQLELRAVEQMRADLEGQRRHLAGLRDDPLVVTRVAQRELAYAGPDERSVRVGRFDQPPARLSQPWPPPVQPPQAVRRVLDGLPWSSHWPMYCDRSRRVMLICLCGATLVAAFLIFPPRPRSRPTGHLVPDSRY